MDIHLKDQILILDEAHNIEDSSREATGFTFTQTQLEDARGDLQHMSKYKNHTQIKQYYLQNLCTILFNV